MVFIGDIAMPFGIRPKVTDYSRYFHDIVIANLEGDIVSEKDISLADRKIHNSPFVLEYLKGLNVKIVSLANNHVFDVHSSPKSYIKELEKVGVFACGAGGSIEEAALPASLKYNNNEILFFSFGWEIMGGRVARKGLPGNNPLEAERVFGSIRSARRAHPEAIIVLLMHWNYEHEIYPQPMHRQIAFKAIDLGANAIIGHHSHCVQGIEIYKNSPIVYGLGNWYFPQGKIWGKNVVFPETSKRELAFEWIPDTGQMTCHWFEYKREEQDIAYLGSEELKQSSFIDKLTPFRGMDHKDYVEWFKRNRKRAFLLPVYEDYRHVFRNLIRDRFVIARNWISKHRPRMG